MDLGDKLKQLRLKCNLTQSEIANRCELTKGYISQLENNITSPSIATLTDLLTVLGTNLSDFFASEQEQQIVFSEDDYFVNNQKDHSIVWLVATSQINEMEPVILTLDPNAKLMLDVPHEGDEFGYILHGNVLVEYGNNSYKAKKGNSFYYKSDKPHSIQNLSNKEKAKILWVSSPPTF